MDVARVVAVDWSGRRTRAEEFIWVAEVRDGRLADLRNGRTPAQLAAWLAVGERRTVVGLDFAFSFPRWYCVARGWRTAEEVWAAAAADGGEMIGAPPFWGPRGRPRQLAPERLYRRTERGLPAKSVFQVAGAGSVGMGSIRGMPFLLELAGRGFSVWPFHPPGWPRVVEIYPRALLGGRVNKSRWAARRAYLLEHHGEQPPALLERAAGSQDAFDAAISALAMAAHAGELAALERAADPITAIEGAVWRPAR